VSTVGGSLTLPRRWKVNAEQLYEMNMLNVPKEFTGSLNPVEVELKIKLPSFMAVVFEAGSEAERDLSTLMFNIVEELIINLIISDLNMIRVFMERWKGKRPQSTEGNVE
jgi:hypothetical protein